MKEGWDKPLTDWIDELEDSFNDEIIQIAKEAFMRIKARTPVDTGKLQAGWVMRQMITQGIFDIVISNDVEYVVLIEHGSDTVAPRLMVEQTLNELIEGTI